MHDLFEIASSSGNHPVRLHQGNVREAVDQCPGAIVIADAFFRDQLASLDRPVLYIDATEEAKEFAAVAPLIERCREEGLTRSGHIVAVGGGVVQDIVCFIATVYMRGVSWTFLPTTLLAMVDSCIGGKSSINVGPFKNLVGSFYPPAQIIVPTDAVQTLPAEHVAAGRCEAAKICFARGDESFADYLEASRQGGVTNTLGTAELVTLSLLAKKWFIEVDEFDQNERLLLNFGHSFGHALESCSDYVVTHGVAVGVGCLAAVAHSEKTHPDLACVDRVRNLRKDLIATLLPVAGLEEALAQVGRADFFRYWGSDKKHSPQEYRPILLDEHGYLYRATVQRDAAADDAIWAAFQDARALLEGSRER